MIPDPDSNRARKLNRNSLKEDQRPMTGKKKRNRLPRRLKQNGNLQIQKIKTAGEKKKDPKASDSAAAKAKPSTAQVKAIESLAERRGINGEQLVKIFTDKFNKPYVEISADEAKNFINYLQHAA